MCKLTPLLLLPFTSGNPGKAEEAGAEEEDGPRFRDRGADSGQDHVAKMRGHVCWWRDGVFGGWWCAVRTLRGWTGLV